LTAFPVLFLLDILFYVYRFYRTDFVAAKTPYAAAVINHNLCFCFYSSILAACYTYGLGIADAFTVPAAYTNVMIDFRPGGKGIYPPF
jgi:hypothetical protein